MRNVNAVLPLALVFAASCVVCGGSAAANETAGGANPPQAQMFDIPKMDKATIDGDPKGWGDGGFRVDEFVSVDGAMAPDERFGARMRLAWNDKGLLALFEVRAASHDESADEKALVTGNSIELLMLDKCGGSEMISAVISPGMDPAHPQLRYRIEDLRHDERLRKVAPILTAARVKVAGGYSLEVLLPWENVGITPKIGTELALQVWMYDYAEGALPLREVWYPIAGIRQFPERSRRIRLAEAPGAPVRVAAKAWYDGVRSTRALVVAGPDSAGKAVSLLADGIEIARGALALDGSRSLAGLEAPLPPVGTEWKSLTVVVDGKTIETLPVPELAKVRTDAARELPFVFHPFCFAGTKLPDGDYEDRLDAERIIGPYTAKTMYFDAEFNPVTSAEKPGRYAAIVEIKPASGLAFRRFFALFRMAGEVSWRGVKVPADITLPGATGLDPEIVREHGQLLADFVRRQTIDGLRRSERGAILMAWLYEAKPGKVANDRTGPESVSERFIHELKRRTGNLTPLQYHVWMPAGADRGEAQKWPLIVFLHGAGGGELASNPVVEYARNKKGFPFIVIAPRCPAGSSWDAKMPELEDFLERVLAEYPVDRERVYLTGASMGGFGSWRLAAEHPDLFAAVVPLCGGGDPRDVERIKDVPVWNFHGGKDLVVPIRLSNEMVEALRKIHGRVRFTVYANCDHNNCADQTYNTDALYSWMLAQSRGKPAEPPTTLTGVVPSELLP
jgi:poly(3-hydroxybutyrate) depolymerase